MWGDATSAKPGLPLRHRVVIAAALVLAAGMGWVALRAGDSGARSAAAAARHACAAPGGSHAPGSRLRDGCGAARSIGSSIAGDGTGAPRIDIAAAMEQVHFAFRQRDGAWRGDHATYSVALQPAGELEVKPLQGAGAGHGRVEGASVRFAPAQIGRGAVVLADGCGEARVNERGQLEIPKGEVVEHLQNTSNGVEQSWTFAAPPEGSGALEVRIPVVAGALVGETESGLHLAAGALGIRYGHGTWIDGLGNRTPVASRWDAGAIVLSVPAEVVDGSVFPAVLDPYIGPERGMDDPVLIPPANTQESPALAWNGTNYLAVWSDGRVSGPARIYGARIRGADGRILDPTGIAIGAAVSDSPAVDWDGENFLVVWRSAGYLGNDISGAQVRGSDGVVLDPGGFVISSASGIQADPAVAWDGTHHMVVWSDYRNGSEGDIYGARVRGSDHAVLDPTGFVIGSASLLQGFPSVAWDGTNYLVVWADSRSGVEFDIFGARVRAADAAVLDPAGIAISTAANRQTTPAVSWNGTNFLVVWKDARGETWDVYGTRIRGSDGLVLDPSGIPIATSPSAEQSPAVTWDGTSHVVAWMSNYGGIHAARVNGSDGTLLDVVPFTITSAWAGFGRIAVAWDGTNYLVAWPGNSDLFGTRVSGSSLTALDPIDFPIATATANSQQAAAVAWDGANYLVVWSDTRNLYSSDIFGVRLRGSDGAVLDPTGIAISTTAIGAWRPAVAWGGADYLVIWEDGPAMSRHVRGARVRGTDGAVLDPTGITVTSGASDQTDAALAWDGTNYLVVWQDTPSGVDKNILGARVRGADGVVLDPAGIVISTASGSQSSPAIAFDGTNHFVAWADGRSGSGLDVYGARVRGSDGALLDSAGIAMSTAAGDQYAPAIAWDGANHFVAWADNRGEPTSDIYGARVRGSDGAVLDASGLAISTAGGQQTEPAVAWDGSHFLVVWQDRRSSTSYDIYAAQVMNGVVLDSSGLLLSGSSTEEGRPQVVSSGPRRFLVVYDAYDPAPAVAAHRIRARDFIRNTSPTLAAQLLSTAEDTPLQIALSGQDADGDPLTYSILQAPNHGTLSGTLPNPTYTPAADYGGPDGFTFRANDGLADSVPSTVALTVLPVNDAPVAIGQTVTLDEDTPVQISLSSHDADGDALTYSVGTPPAHGSLSGSGASLTYSPAVNFNGRDSFTFMVNDGTVGSEPSVVELVVNSVDDPSTGGCSCASSGDMAPLGLLVLGMLGFGRGRGRRSRARC